MTEHIHGAVERFKKGIQIKILFNWYKRLFRDEYEVSKQALEAIKEEFGIEFEEDEAGYIAQHIVNAQLDDDMSDIVNVTRIMQDILNIIKYSYKIDLMKSQCIIIGLLHIEILCTKNT